MEVLDSHVYKLPETSELIQVNYHSFAISCDEVRTAQRKINFNSKNETGQLKMLKSLL